MERNERHFTDLLSEVYRQSSLSSALHLMADAAHRQLGRDDNIIGGPNCAMDGVERGFGHLQEHWRVSVGTHCLSGHG